MAKRKKPVYKTGRKNPNAYRDYRRIYDRLILLAIVLVILLFGIITTLEKFNIISWGELLNKFSVIDTVSQTDSDFTIRYLNAGQSDCTIITCGDQTMLIDTGTYNQIDTIASALKSLNITKIDYLVITHQHDDHMGCATRILKDYDVKNIIMPKLSEINMVTTVSYEELLNTISEKEVRAIAAEPGLKFNVGEATVNFYSPLSQDKNLNNMSSVFKVVYGETSFLFQGDAEKKVEKALIKEGYDLTADIIKVGHHGSNTSSTEKYIKAVSPKAAIISCGAGNEYGHPHSETIETLNQNGVDIFVTMLLGDITVTSDGKTINITTSKSDEVKTYE